MLAFPVVLEGVVGTQIAERVIEAGPGAVLAKPRGVPHAFWNPRDQPARLLEIIPPRAFEQYFTGLADIPSGPRAPILDSWPPLPAVTAWRSTWHQYRAWLPPTDSQSHYRSACSPGRPQTPSQQAIVSAPGTPRGMSAVMRCMAAMHNPACRTNPGQGSSARRSSVIGVEESQILGSSRSSRVCATG